MSFCTLIVLCYIPLLSCYGLLSAVFFNDYRYAKLPYVFLLSSFLCIVLNVIFAAGTIFSIAVSAVTASISLVLYLVLLVTAQMKNEGVLDFSALSFEKHLEIIDKVVCDGEFSSGQMNPICTDDDNAISCNLLTPIEAIR